MLLQELREQVSEYGKRMLRDGLTRGTLGYISARDPESGLVCSTPSSMDYMQIGPAEVLVSDVDGNVLEGTGKVSSEWNVERDIYKTLSHVHALVHTHSTFAATLSTLQIELPAAYFTVCYSGGGSVPCIPFYDFYSQELADATIEKLKDRKALLMGAHGMLAAGADLKEAYTIASEIEFSAEVYWRAKCIGNPYILTPEEVNTMVKQIYRYTHTNDK